MSLATGRWTGIDTSKPRVGDPVVIVVNPERKSGWRTVIILAAVAAGIYILSPGAAHFVKHGHLPPEHPDDRDCQPGQDNR